MRKNYVKLIVSLFLLVGTLFSCSVSVEEPGGNGVSTGSASPINLKVDRVDESRVALSWNALEGETYYGVFCSGQENGEFILLQPTVVNSTTVTWLLPSTDYYFQVRELKGYKVYGRVSNIVKATTKMGTLAAPVITSTSSTGYSTTINWEPVAGADAYAVYRMDFFGGKIFYSGFSNTTTHEDIYKIESGQVYTYKVIGLNKQSGVASAESKESVITARSATLKVPAKNYLVNSYEISWDSSALNWGEEIELRNYSDSTGSKMLDNVRRFDRFGPYNFFNVEPGKTYYYRIRLNNTSTGESSPFSELFSITIPLPEKSDSPQNFKVDSIKANSQNSPLLFDKSMVCSWDPILTAESYYIYAYVPEFEHIIFLGESPSTNFTFNFFGANYSKDLYYNIVVRAVNRTTREAGPFSAPLRVKIR